MYTGIIEDLDILGNTRNQLNDNNLEFFSALENYDDEDQNLQTYDLEYNEIIEDGDLGNNTESLAQKLNLDYPSSTSQFKKNFDDFSLKLDFSNTIAPTLTTVCDTNLFEGKSGGPTQIDNSMKDALAFVDSDIIGLSGKGDSNRDPLISSVAGSISSSSFSLDLSNGQLSPSSILSSIDLRSFSTSQSDLEKEITYDIDQRPALQSMSSSSSFLMVNIPPSVITKQPNDNAPSVLSPDASYIKQPRQGRYSAHKKTTYSTPNSASTGNHADYLTTDMLGVPAHNASAETEQSSSNSAGPSHNEHNKKVSDSRLSAQGLAQVLNLDSPVEALKRERYILDIFENELHYPLGYKTWVRDTTKEYRIKLIDELYDRVKDKYPEYDRHVLETIIRRATYYMMQSRLRRERRAKAKGIKLARSSSSVSSIS